ncbi:MAG: TonB-dependent receptor, partial [Salinimicrobium sp.]
MRNWIACLFLLIFFNAGAQNIEKITLDFSNLQLKEVLFQIEGKTDYRFFFDEDWLPKQPLSGNYKNVGLKDLLNDLLEGTLLNYHFFDDRIILTKNSVVYDELPGNFFERDQFENRKVEDEEKEAYNPVFYEDIEQLRQVPVETVYIGRANRAKSTTKLTLEGQITSAKDGQPITDIAVSVRNTNIGTVTDAYGYYRLRLPAGVNIVETNSLGNEDIAKKVIIYNNGRLDFILKEDFQQLGEILLESNPDSNVKDALGGTEKVNVEEIKNIPLVLGERDILKVSTTLPGISSAGEGAAGFNVRGGRADQNLILLDNAVLYNPAHFFGIFSALNPFTTGAVDIYKGHIPAYFGGRLSSVFDIKTKKANVNQYAGEGAIGPVTGNFTVEVPIVKGKAGFLAGVRSTYSDWILRSLDEDALKNNEASFYDVVAKYNHKIRNDTDLDIMVYYSNDRFNITRDSLYSYRNELLSMSLTHRFNNRHQANLQVTSSGYKFNIDYEGQFADNFRSGYNINETGTKLHLRYKLNKQHHLDYGISGKIYLVDPGEIEALGIESAVEARKLSREKGLEAAVFIADEFEVSEKLLLNLGLRFSTFSALGEGIQRIYKEDAPKRESSLVDMITYSNNEVIKTYGGPEIRVSGRYLLKEDLSLKANYNSTYQYIHTLSTNTTASPTDTYKLSDANIKPQKANQFSLGLYKNLYNNSYELSVEGYYKRSNEILDYKVGANLFLNEAIETEILQGEGKSYGAELLLKKKKGDLNG